MGGLNTTREFCLFLLSVFLFPLPYFFISLVLSFPSFLNFPNFLIFLVFLLYFFFYFFAFTLFCEMSPTGRKCYPTNP